MKRHTSIALVGLVLAIVACGILWFEDVTHVSIHDRIMTHSEFDTCVAEWAKQAAPDFVMSQIPDQNRHAAYRKLLAHGWAAAPFVIERIEATAHQTETGDISNERLLDYVGLINDLTGFDVYKDSVYRKRAFAIDSDGSGALLQSSLGVPDPVPIYLDLAHERIIEWWHDEGTNAYEQRLGSPVGNTSPR